MNKKVAGIVIIFFFIFLLTIVIARASEYEEVTTWTKALYDGRYLQDFLIICKGKKVVNLIPVHGKIYVGRNWKDPRDDYWQNKWCE